MTRPDRRAEFLARWVRMVPANGDQAAMRRSAIRHLRTSVAANPPVATAER